MLRWGYTSYCEIAIANPSHYDDLFFRVMYGEFYPPHFVRIDM